MAKITKIIVQGVSYDIRDKELNDKIIALLATELDKPIYYTAEDQEVIDGTANVGDLNENANVQYWVPDTVDKAKFDALTASKILKIKGAAAPTAEDLEDATIDEYIDDQYESGEAAEIGDLWLITYPGDEAGVVREYFCKATDPANAWEFLGTIEGVDMSGKADTTAVKSVFDAFVVNPIEASAIDPDADPVEYEEYELVIPQVAIAASDITDADTGDIITPAGQMYVI